ncbi:MAG: Gfo/Idh/MocA family oxidoreductase [Planctomycetota bacterium]|nr:Gfo/Idh/MocA family oxidoreductase [Planctomycetota bacterium]
MSQFDRRTFLATAAGAALVALTPGSLPAAVRAHGAPLGVGIVGCGRQGRRLLLELVERLGAGAKVVALCDTVERNAESQASRARGARVFADHAAMLRDAPEVEAVIIATPTHLHKDIALACIAAGKHVYCEAPIAHTVEDCVAIAKAARGSGKVFAVGCEGRSNPVYQLARTFFRSDAVRDLVSMYAQNHYKTPWGRPGDWWLDPSVSLGLAGEWGVQQFDVLHWYRGSYPASVSGHGSIRLHQDGREVHDAIRCTFRWDDDREAHYDATCANSFGGRHETFTGVNAAIKLAWSHAWMFKEADAPTQGWEVYANRQQFHNDEGITLIAGATKLAEQGKLKEGVGLPYPPHYYALNDFLASIIDKAEVRCSASEGARATIVAIHAARAVKEGTRVDIDPALLREV